MPNYHHGTVVLRNLAVVGTLDHVIPRARRFVQRGADPRFEVTSKQVFVKRNTYINGAGHAVSPQTLWRSSIPQIAGRARGTRFKGQAKPVDGVIRSRMRQLARAHNSNRPPMAVFARDAARRPAPRPPPPRPQVHRPRPNIAAHAALAPPLPAASSVPAGAPEVKLGSCSICLTEHANCVWTGCGHAAACLTCVHEMKRSRRHPCCPLCRAPGEVIRVFTVST